MKKFVSAVLVTVLVLTAASSFTGCNVFSAMRENAELAAQTTLFGTPDEAEALKDLNDYVDFAFDNAEKITESVSYKVNGADFLKDGESAGLLDDAASMLKTLIMSAGPGSSEREITDRADAGLLGTVSADGAMNYTVTRNTEAKNIVDEEGNAVTNESGENVTEIVDADNALNYRIEYFAPEKDESETLTEDEEIKNVSAPDEVIESVFGLPADKTAVLAAFDCVADYLEVKDYEISYGDCAINAVTDMEEGVVSSVNFAKGMLVTAKVIGVGAMEEYGEMTVELVVTRNTDYSFSYPVEEETI